jgi:hypothetical protein
MPAARCVRLSVKKATKELFPLRRCFLEPDLAEVVLAVLRDGLAGPFPSGRGTFPLRPDGRSEAVRRPVRATSVS